MEKIPLTRAGWFLQITNALEDCGSSPERLVRSLNMPMWHHCPRDGFIPVDHVFRLLEHGARSVGSATFGARVMEPVQLREIATIGEPIVGAPTVYRALQTSIRMVSLHGAAKRYWLVEGRDEVWFCRGGDDVFDFGERFVIQYALTFMVKVVRLGAGPGWRPSKVLVQATDTLGLETTEMFSDAAIMPDRAMSAIAVPRSLLGLPIRRNRPHAPSNEISDAQLQASAPPDDLAGSLRQVIATALSEGCPQIEDAAEIAGLHLRTLQRRLERDGVTYEQLVDEVRYEAAAHLLKAPDATVTDIAFDLGYTDVSHFSRAFRRWTGVSPRAYRRLNLAH